MTEQAKKQNRKSQQRGKALDPRVAAWVLDRVTAIGLVSATAELCACIRDKCQAYPERVDAKKQIKVLQSNCGHRFQPYWHTYFGVWSGMRGNVVEVPTLDPMEMPVNEPDSGVFEAQTEQPTAHQETGIVRVVDGIPWTLPTLTKDGAEQARIRLTDLAKALGYENKQGLSRLAERNASQISELGTIVMMTTVSGFGRITPEPAYTYDQAVYLALSSETEQGRASRVRIIQAYKALLAMFEQAVTAQPQIAILERTLAALAANQNTTNLLLQSLLERQQSAKRRLANPAQQVIPQTVQGKVSEKRRNLDSQVVAAACLPPNATKEEREALCRAKWNELYHALQRKGINAQLGMAQCEADGMPCESKVDWLERYGYLDDAIATAKQIWKPTPAVRAVR